MAPRHRQSPSPSAPRLQLLLATTRLQSHFLGSVPLHLLVPFRLRTNGTTRLLKTKGLDPSSTL